MNTHRVIRKPFVLSLLVSALAATHACRAVAPTAIYDSGGKLQPEQAAYDVEYYDLALNIDPTQRSIRGRLTAHVLALAAMEWLVLDLDTVFTIDSVGVGSARAGQAFERRGGKLWLRLPRAVAVGERVVTSVWYGGRPLVAKPARLGGWADGFFWERTLNGQHWIGNVSVLNGADIWWPTKDHPSDEPDSMQIDITVPEPLVVASNGRLRQVSRVPDGRISYRWFVSTPISNYSVTVNAAPYRTAETLYRSITGKALPFTIWQLPEQADDDQEMLTEFTRHMRFLEELLGPYPFQADKYGVVATPYIAMENQTIIAHRPKLERNRFGFDALHLHELTHEWFANQLTAADWKDWWIHEGFATYIGALYAEHLGGEQDYFAYVQENFSTQSFINSKPVAPRESQTSREIFSMDLYLKGAWILHSLRTLIGKKEVLRFLREMTGADDARRGRNRCGCRFVTTEDVQDAAERISGKELDWFFEGYLRRAAVPRLRAQRTAEQLRLRWEVEGVPGFAMPLEVSVAGNVLRVDMSRGDAVVAVPTGATLVIDPQQRVLKDLVTAENATSK